MEASTSYSLPRDFLSELERKFFWWEPVGSQPRSDIRILAQAMSLGWFEDMGRLERVVGPFFWADVRLEAGPGWINEGFWDFGRGRLQLGGGGVIPEPPPRRSFEAGAF